jgi:hypothetical protein
MDNKILFPAIITSIEDPLMIGRVRAEIESDRNDDILKSITDPPFNIKKDIWGDRDPFIFKPLLPYYYNTPLAVGEMVLVIFANKDFKFDNQYFIQSDFTSPMRANFNSNVEARITTGSGRRFKSNLSLKNLDGTYRKNKTKNEKHNPKLCKRCFYFEVRHFGLFYEYEYCYFTRSNSKVTIS